MITYFGSQISPNKVETAEGFLICRNVPIARIGDQEYLAREIQLQGDPDRRVTVHRYPEEVFSEATVASFEGKPVTDTHPSEFVDPDNFKDLAKGHVQNVRREGDYIVGDLYINDAGLIEKIQNGTKEVSCGYVCTYEPDGGDYKQTHIRGNHVAVVQYGRAGHEVAIKDAATGVAEKGRTLMSRFKEVLAAFGTAAKDAEPKDLEALTTLADMAMDAQEAAPAEPEKEEAQEAAPAEEAKDEMVEKAPKGDDLGTKLDKVISMLSTLLEKKSEDEKPKDEKEKETEEFKEELDKELDKQSKVLSEEEEVIEEEDCKEAKDFMSVLTPAINGISDKKQRAAVSDAILKALGTDSMKEMLKTTETAAKKASDAASKTSYEVICEEAQAAYAARNPHTKKEA